MDKDVLLQAINYLLTFVGSFVFILLIKNFLQVLAGVKWKLKNFKRAQVLELFKQMATPLFGVLVMFCSFALTNTILGGVMEVQSEAITQEALKDPQTIKEALMTIEYTGYFGTLFFILAGYAYVLSGFGSWLKWVARAFMLIAPLYILSQIVRYAVLAN